MASIDRVDFGQLIYLAKMAQIASTSAKSLKIAEQMEVLLKSLIAELKIAQKKGK